MSAKRGIVVMYEKKELFTAMQFDLFGLFNAYFETPRANNAQEMYKHGYFRTSLKNVLTHNLPRYQIDHVFRSKCFIIRNISHVYLLTITCSTLTCAPTQAKRKPASVAPQYRTFNVAQPRRRAEYYLEGPPITSLAIDMVQ